MFIDTLYYDNLPNAWSDAWKCFNAHGYKKYEMNGFDYCFEMYMDLNPWIVDKDKLVTDIYIGIKDH